MCTIVHETGYNTKGANHKKTIISDKIHIRRNRLSVNLLWYHSITSKTKFLPYFFTVKLDNFFFGLRGESNHSMSKLSIDLVPTREKKKSIYISIGYRCWQSDVFISSGRFLFPCGRQVVPIWFVGIKTEDLVSTSQWFASQLRWVIRSDVKIYI